MQPGSNVKLPSEEINPKIHSQNQVKNKFTFKRMLIWLQNIFQFVRAEWNYFNFLIFNHKMNVLHSKMMPFPI